MEAEAKEAAAKLASEKLELPCVNAKADAKEELAPDETLVPTLQSHPQSPSTDETLVPTLQSHPQSPSTDETLVPTLQSLVANITGDESRSMERFANDFPREGDADWEEFYDQGYRYGDHLLFNIPNPRVKGKDPPLNDPSRDPNPYPYPYPYP